MNAPKDLSQDLAHFVATTRFEDLPAKAVEAAKKSLLDTLGVTLAASGMEPAVKALVDLVVENGGKPESTVFGFGGKAPAAMAAFANGAMAHCLDFDDQTPWGAHPDSSVVPTLLALAEHKGGVSGEDLITAIAIGQELFIRLRCNVGWKMDWNLSTVVGAFSATAAGCSLMRLTPQQTANALGIASMQSGGTMELIFGLGSDLRGMYAGFTAKGAVLAVQLAQRGITGIQNLFEGEAGQMKVYFRGEYAREKILDKLGTEFLSGGMIYKYWPAVGNAHTYIHAAIELRKEHRIALEDISEIRVYVGDFQQRMCSPLDVRRIPKTLVDAKFSLPFLVALALAKGQMKIQDFSVSALEDPTVLALSSKVVPVPDKEFDWKLKLPDGKIELIMLDGSRIEKLGANVPGAPELPMTWDQLGQKFTDCARAAVNPVPEGTISRAIQTIQHLENVASVTELI
jgi:2-methylcitrate dehydratase PrpD